MKRFAIVSILSLVLGAVVVTPVFADIRTFTGALVPGGPTTTSTAIISTPACTGGTVAFQVLYQAFVFQVTASGVYTITEPGVESAVYVYSGSFDPTAVASNCAFASNTNPINFTASLTAGQQYVLVVIEDTFAQDGLNFAVTIRGPGDILLVGEGVAAVPTLSLQGLLLMVLILAAAGTVALRRAKRSMQA